MDAYVYLGNAYTEPKTNLALDSLIRGRTEVPRSAA